MIDRGDGAPLHPDTLSSRWGVFLARAGLPHVRFHDLRHAHATLMLLQGVHPKVVSERLGHASVGITLDTYSHVLPAMQAEATQGLRRAVRGQGVKDVASTPVPGSWAWLGPLAGEPPYPALDHVGRRDRLEWGETTGSLPCGAPGSG